MFENLSDKLERAFKVLKGQGSITEINVAETMKEIDAEIAASRREKHVRTAKA